MARQKLSISDRYSKPAAGAEFYKIPQTLGRPARKTILAQDKAFHPALEMLRRDFPLNASAALPCFLGYGHLLSLAQDGLIRAGVEMLADDCVAKWIELSEQGERDEDEDGNGLPDMDEDIRRYNVKDLLRRAVASCGYFGGCLVFIDTGDKQEDLVNPLVLDGQTFRQGSLKTFTIIDPYNISPGQYNSTNPCAPDYYRPSSWYVQGIPIHESRFLYFAMNDLPALLRPAYNFFGIPLAQTVLDAVKHFTECREAAARLLTKFSLTVLKTNLDEILTGGAGEMIGRRVQYMVQNRNNDGVEVIDKEAEDIINVTTPLSGVTDIVRQSMEMVAAYFKEPVTKMWGISPAGFNATGENDMRNHHEHILATQEKILRQPLGKILKILRLNRSGKLDETLTFHFVPLNEENKAALAATQKTKAETDNMYLEMGVLSPEEVRQSLIDDPESGYGGLDPYEMPEAPEEMAQAEGAPVSGEGQSVGFGQPLADAAFDEAGDGKEWITVNGAHIPLKDGEPSGNVGEKIKAETAKNDSFGKAYPEYSGHPEKAIEKLMNEKAGHVPAAIHKDGIGAIDFVYGEGGKRGYGLAHIADKHGMETVKKVPAIIREGSVDRKHEGFGRIYVSDAKKKAVVRLDWNGQSRKWLATAFDIDE